jgi:calreticulin
LPDPKIKDPNVEKPDDWVDEAMIDDPNDQKPEDWDKEPEFIPDTSVFKPEDWDDEEDGEWQRPTIPNLKFKGVWKPKVFFLRKIHVSKYQIQITKGHGNIQ